MTKVTSLPDALVDVGQTVEVMHGSNAPLLGRIIQNQMEKVKTGEPVTESIALEDAVPGFKSTNNNLICLNCHLLRE